MKQPLADTLRPNDLNGFIGQDHLVGKSGPIRKMIERDSIPSMIFWGPPASGKTTLAKIIANATQSEFYQFSAVMDGKSKLREVLEQSKVNENFDQHTILFIDEIHRWSKSQQDALLPFIESGQITLIGATTENPSFTVISALISRSRVFTFKPHTDADLIVALQSGLKKLSGKLTKKTKEAMQLLAELSNGDMRFAINSLEVSYNISDGNITKAVIEKSVQKVLRYDKKGDEHYNLISAVHKSMRSSNPSAAVYWICRMLDGGEDPLYIARRLLRFASEDIGNSSPTALLIANNVYDTCHKLGMPECGVALAQLAQYLSLAPKDNSAYIAYESAMSDVQKYGNLEVPLHFRNPTTKLMKEMGYGKGYKYDHDVEGGKSGQQCLPDELKYKKYFK